MKRVLWFSLSLATLSLSACGRKDLEADYANAVSGAYGVTMYQQNGRITVLPQTGQSASIAITRTADNTVNLKYMAMYNFKVVTDRTEPTIIVGKATTELYTLTLNGTVIGTVTSTGRAEIDIPNGLGRWSASKY